MYSKIFNNFDTLFDELLDNKLKINHTHNSKIFNTKNGKVLVVEVPGFTKDDLKVEIEEVYLRVEGEKTFSFGGGEKFGTSNKISQTFYLGQNHNFDLNNCEAEVKDGLLIVRFTEQTKLEKKKIINLL